MTEWIRDAHPVVMARLVAIMRQQLNATIDAGRPAGMALPGIDSAETVYPAPNQRVGRRAVANANVWVLIYPTSDDFEIVGDNVGDPTSNYGHVLWPFTVELGCVDLPADPYTVAGADVASTGRMMMRQMHYFGAILHTMMEHAPSTSTDDAIRCVEIEGGPEYDALGADDGTADAYIGTVVTEWIVTQEVRIPKPAYSVADPM